MNHLAGFQRARGGQFDSGVAATRRVCNLKITKRLPHERQSADNLITSSSACSRRDSKDCMEQSVSLGVRPAERRKLRAAYICPLICIPPIATQCTAFRLFARLLTSLAGKENKCSMNRSLRIRKRNIEKKTRYSRTDSRVPEGGTGNRRSVNKSEWKSRARARDFILRLHFEKTFGYKKRTCSKRGVPKWGRVFPSRATARCTKDKDRGPPRGASSLPARERASESDALLPEFVIGCAALLFIPSPCVQIVCWVEREREGSSLVHSASAEKSSSAQHSESRVEQAGSSSGSFDTHPTDYNARGVPSTWSPPAPPHPDLFFCAFPLSVAERPSSSCHGRGGGRRSVQQPQRAALGAHSLFSVDFLFEKFQSGRADRF